MAMAMPTIRNPFLILRSEWLGLYQQSMFPLYIAISLRYISISIGASKATKGVLFSNLIR
jgi:hypothetical protein